MRFDLIVAEVEHMIFQDVSDSAFNCRFILPEIPLALEDLQRDPSPSTSSGSGYD